MIAMIEYLNQKVVVVSGHVVLPWKKHMRKKVLAFFLFEAVELCNKD